MAEQKVKAQLQQKLAEDEEKRQQEQKRILEIEEKNRQLVIQAAYEAEQKMSLDKAVKGKKGGAGRRIKPEDDFVDNREIEDNNLDHYQLD